MWGSTNVGGVYYVYYNASEFSVSSWGESSEMSLSDTDAADSISFQASKNMGTAVDPLIVYQLVNGSWGEVTRIKVGDIAKDKFKSFGPFALNRAATKIKFKGGSYTRTIKDLKVTMAQYIENPSATAVDCGTGALHVTTSQSFTITWCNVPAMNLEIQGDSNGEFAWSIENNAEPGQRNTATVTVTANNKTAGQHNATLKITDSFNNYSQSISLSATTNKQTATMSWKEGTNIMNLYETLSAEALTCSDPTRAITFTSSDSSIIDIMDGVPVAIAVGSATITAIQAENAEFYQTTAAQEITVTSKQKQILDWTDKLSFKFEGTPFVQELTAQAQTELTYSLSDVKDNCVSLEGNVLTIKAAGTAYVTATAVETDEFVGVSMTRKIIIRDANASCETFIYGPSAEHEFDLGWNAANHQTKTKEIDFGGQEPRYVNFDYKGKSHNVIIEYYNGTLRIDQYVNGGWQEVKNLGTPKKNGNYTNTGNISLNRKATKMRVRAEDGMGYMYFKDCVVTLAKYLESSTDALQFDAQVGVSQTKTFNVSYSDVQGPIEITSSNSNILSFSQNAIEADCEQHGTVQITVTLNSTEVIDQIAETITISNGVEAPLTIAVSGTVAKRGQEILWNDATTYYAIETPSLSATATSELPITYTSSNTEIAQVINGNQLEFYAAGTVEITANQEGNDLYNAASSSKTLTIHIVPTEIVTVPVLPDSVLMGTTIEQLVLEGGKAQNTFNQEEVEGSFAITEGDLSTVGEHQLTVTFTPANANIYTSSTTTITIKVVEEIAPLNRSLIWEAAAENTVYTIDTVVLNAKVVDDNNALAGEVAFAIAPTSTEGCGQLVDTTLTFAKAGQVTINATVADDPVYVSIEPVSKVWNVVITPTEITTAPTTMAEVVMGTALTDLTLEGGAAQNTITNKPVEGTFAITDGDLSTVGSHDLTVTFTPNNTDMYATATTTISISVIVVLQPTVLTWTVAPETIYLENETELFEATSNREGEIVYSIEQDEEIVLLDYNVPGMIYLQAIGTFTIKATQAATDIYEAATIEKTVEVKKMSSPTELQNNAATSKAKKVIINNQIVILREGGMYSITGQKIK